MSISDHVRNIKTKQIQLYIDYFLPEATISLDPTCSWYSGIRYDATPVCELNVILTDDVLSHLLGNYRYLFNQHLPTNPRLLHFLGVSLALN